MGIAAVKALSSVENNGGSVTLKFTSVAEIEANKPYLIKMSVSKDGITKSATTYSAADQAATTTVDNGTITASMIATLVKMDLPNDVYYITDNMFYHTEYSGETKTSMKAFRAYFTVTDNSGEVKSLNYNLDDNATGIEEVKPVNGPSVNGQYYDISGRRVQQPTKGLYIVNGKKVFVK